MAALFEVTGVDAVSRRLQDMLAVVLPISAIALEQEADAGLAHSKELVPVDTGSLRDSGVVDQAQLTATTAEVTLRYGGTVGRAGRRPETYAIRIEFDVTMHHPRGGQALFLTTATMALAQGMAGRLADAIRVAL